MEDKIELKQLIDILLKGKIIILVTTILCMVFSGIVSWFVIDEKYESKAVVQIVNNVQDTGVLTNLVAAEFTPNVYAQRIQNKTIMDQALKEAGITENYDDSNLIATVDANQDVTKNYISLRYTSKSATDAKKQLEILMSATTKKMDEAVKEPLIEMGKSYNNQIKVLTKEIESIIGDYNQIIRENNLPKVLIMQTLLNSEISLEITEEQMAALANVNGAQQNQLLQLQAQIETKSEKYRSVLENYQSVELGLENFKSDPYIRVIAEPTLAEDPSSPNKVLNLIIGLILGVMLGIGIVLIRSYWKNSVSTN